MENISLYLIVACVLILVYMKSEFEKRVYKLDIEYTVFVWLLNISVLEDLGQNTEIDKEALFNFLDRTQLKIPGKIVKDTKAIDWLPEKYVSNKKGALYK